MRNDFVKILGGYTPPYSRGAMDCHPPPETTLAIIIVRIHPSTN